MPIFHHFHQLEKIEKSRATLTNPNFQYFSELEKILKYSLRPALKNLNFESKGELKNYVPI